MCISAAVVLNFTVGEERGGGAGPRVYRTRLSCCNMLSMTISRLKRGGGEDGGGVPRSREGAMSSVLLT